MYSYLKLNNLAVTTEMHKNVIETNIELLVIFIAQNNIFEHEIREKKWYKQNASNRRFNSRYFYFLFKDSRLYKLFGK